MSQSVKSTALFFSVISISILVLFVACAKKDKQADIPQPEPSAQSAVPAPAPEPTPAPEPAPAPKPTPSYDYTDIKDVEMDGSAAIGKTCKMKILMDYSGIDEGTFRAYTCNGGEMYSGVNFRMSFDASTKSDVRNLKSMECGGTAIFKITGKGRIEKFTAKLIELSAY